jgi:hypothetical protein
MDRREFISHALIPAFAGATVCGLPGCGALFQSERCGRPHSNDIDWKIAALDGLGLLLFFVPGVIAFVVDFSTGAIYLPVEQSYPGYGAGPQVPVGMAPRDTLPPPVSKTGPAPAAQSSTGQPQRAPTAQQVGLKRVVIPREQLEPPYLEQVVEKHAGREISLDGTENRVSELPSIDQFDEQLNRHRADRNFGYSVRSFFAELARA